MSICPYCKNENPDKNKFCNYCGASLENTEPFVEEPAPVPEPEPENLPVPENNDIPDISNAHSPFENNADAVSYNQSDSLYSEQVPKIPIGGLVAWSIFNILFCTIPGAIGLYYVLKINKATSVEEQQKALDTAKKVLIIGSVLAVINLISQIGLRMS